jgi:hypothetical protein
VESEANLSFVAIHESVEPGLNPGAFVAIIHEPGSETFLDSAVLLGLWAIARGHTDGWNEDKPAVIAVYDGTTGALHGVQPIGVTVIAEREFSWN